MDIEFNAKEIELIFATLMTQQVSMRRWIAHSKDQAEIEYFRQYLDLLNDIVDKIIATCQK